MAFRIEILQIYFAPVFVLRQMNFHIAQVLEIGNFSLKADDGTEIISLKKNGEVVVNQQVIGKLSSDGRLTDTNGKASLAISEFGLVPDSDKINYGLIYKHGILDNGSQRQIST
jgi:hypothetical protein